MVSNGSIQMIRGLLFEAKPNDYQKGVSVGMKKGLTLILTLILLMNITQICLAEEVYSADSDPLLQGVVDRAHSFSENHLGYPLNDDIELKEFYDWYLENDIDRVMMNNAGDPNNITTNHGALEVENEVLRFFAPFYGFDPDEAWGLISASGTDGNNHGIYFGRHYLEDVTDMVPILYVSTESHYSNMRLAELQQMEVRLIDTDEMGAMIPESFREALDPERPALVVFSMGTTFKGGIDDQQAINAILNEVNPPAVYRHVDAALFGGYLPFSAYADKVDQRVCGFDSIAISGHKFFGIDDPCGLFFTSKEVMAHQNPYDISYLEGSMPMINCSRSATNPLKFYWIVKHKGAEGFKAMSERMFEVTTYLKEKLDEIGWPAWISDECSTTVFFARPDEATMEKYFLAPDYDERFGGELAHVVVMPNVKTDLIDRFVVDLQAQQETIAPAA